jgi:hypothetical protein
MKKLKLTVSSFIIVVGLSLNAVESNARRATDYEQPKMPNFKNECQQLTKIRTRVSYRIDHRATARCIAASEAQWRQEQIDNSYIESNKASAEADREWARYLRTR